MTQETTVEIALYDGNGYGETTTRSMHIRAHGLTIVSLLAPHNAAIWSDADAFALTIGRAVLTAARANGWHS